MLRKALRRSPFELCAVSSPIVKVLSAEVHRLPCFETLLSKGS
jgi:hypothetical protein